MQAWELSDDMLAGLAKMLKLDSDNYVARVRVKLIKISKGLNRPRLKCSLPIMTRVMVEVDRIQYDCLGFNKVRKSLVDMLHPETSPIVIAQRADLKLLSSWVPRDAEEDTEWSLVGSIGGSSAQDVEVMMISRREVLQVSAGILTHFELRLSEATYAGTSVCQKNVSARWRQRGVSTFYSTPVACLSVMGRK